TPGQGARSTPRGRAASRAGEGDDPSVRPRPWSASLPRRVTGPSNPYRHLFLGLRGDTGMDRNRSFLRVGLVLLAAAALVIQALPAQAGIARGSFRQTNLVSDVPGLAPLKDPNLVNPWGLSSRLTSPIWVSDNGKS